MKKLIRKLFFGDAVIREYSPVAIGGEISERVYLEMPGRILDVSQDHWLLSLEPVVLGVWIEKKEDILALDARPPCTLYFNDRGMERVHYSAHEKNIRTHAVAIADMDHFDKIVEEDGVLFLLKMRKSKIRHLNFVKILLLFFGFYKKPRLSFEQFKSLVASHSYPRRVRVISFREGEAFNIFPMDLLGDIARHRRFVFGLRHSNHSLPRIMATKKIVVSEASSGSKGMIYQLGKHHQSGPVAMDSLPFQVIRTETFGFYVPEWVLSYKEIELTRTMNLGSHMLLWGRAVNEKKIAPPVPNLFHIPFMLWLHQKKRGHEYPVV